RAAAATCWSGTADRGPLVHQRSDRDLPSLALATHDSVGGDFHVGHEHFVELGLPGYLMKWANLDAGALHVEEEVRHSGVLRRVGIAAREQHRPFRHMRETGPDV